MPAVCLRIGKNLDFIMASLMLLEQVGQVPAVQRLSTNSLVESAIKSWTSELEQDARSVRQAPMFTIAILMSCRAVPAEHRMQSSCLAFPPCTD